MGVKNEKASISLSSLLHGYWVGGHGGDLGIVRPVVSRSGPRFI